MVWTSWVEKHSVAVKLGVTRHDNNGRAGNKVGGITAGTGEGRGKHSLHGGRYEWFGEGKAAYGMKVSGQFGCSARQFDATSG